MPDRVEPGAVLVVITPAFLLHVEQALRQVDVEHDTGIAVVIGDAERVTLVLEQQARGPARIAAIGAIAAGCGSAGVAAPTTTARTTTTTIATTSPPSTEPSALPVDPLTGTITYSVVATYPHDTGAYTQGLEFVDDALYESTGERGESDRRIVDLDTGMASLEVPIDANLFGEGMTERDGLLYQLTYTSGLLLRADVDTLEEVAPPLSYDGEGWGLCAAENLPDQPFVMSNGSDELTIRNPETFDIERTVSVRDGDGASLDLLNELECLGDWVLANRWFTNDIVAIDLADGSVVGTLDLTELVPPDLDRRGAVLNGIAYRASTGTYFVTGKLWPVLYELELTSG